MCRNVIWVFKYHLKKFVFKKKSNTTSCSFIVQIVIIGFHYLYNTTVKAGFEWSVQAFLNTLRSLMLCSEIWMKIYYFFRGVLHTFFTGATKHFTAVQSSSCPRAKTMLLDISVFYAYALGCYFLIQMMFLEPIITTACSQW